MLWGFCFIFASMNQQKTAIFPNERQVSALGQGTWKMGISPGKRSEEYKALRTGIDLGMEIIDTAEMYDNEEFVSEVIAGIRDKVFLISKVLPSNASRRGTKTACERSLRKLDTDYLDLYLLHWSGSYPFEDTVEAMLELQREGKIKEWGVSNMDVYQMEHFFAIRGGNTCAANQVAYNLTTRGIEYDLLPWCAQRNMPVIAYSPVGEGSLVQNKLLKEIAEKHNATPTQIALAWVMRNPGMIAIPKASTVKHVEENFRSLSIRLTEEDYWEIDRAYPPPNRKIPLAGW